MDFDAVADELYALPTNEFVKARNACVKRARADGARPLAQRIQALQKPTTAAWLANQLVREHRGEIEPLFELGRELREVMAELGGDELRELTRQRFKLVSGLVQQARVLGGRRGVRVSDDVAQALRSTFEATLSDAASAEAVSSGRLTDALRVSGFGVAEAPDTASQHTDITAGSSKGSAAGGDASVSDLSVERQRRRAAARERAEHAVTVAEQAAQRAHAAQDNAGSRLDAVTRQRQEAVGAVERLEEELRRAGGVLDQRDMEAQAVREEVDAAERAVSAAERERRDALERLEQLTD